MDWLQQMRDNSHTVETLVGPALVSETTALELAVGWTTLAYKTTIGMRVWLEEGLACESYPGRVTAVCAQDGQVVIFDDTTGDRLGCHRAVDICALSPMDLGPPGAQAVVAGSRSTMFVH